MAFKLNYRCILCALLNKAFCTIFLCFSCPLLSAFSCMLPAPPPDQPATVYLTVPTQKDLENGTATFLCLAQQFSPKKYSFKWFKDGQQVANTINTYDTSEKNGSVTLYSATSSLQISAEEWKTAAKIKCEFEHKTGKEVREAAYTGMFSLEDCECFEKLSFFYFSIHIMFISP